MSRLWRLLGRLGLVDTSPDWDEEPGSDDEPEATR